MDAGAWGRDNTAVTDPLAVRSEGDVINAEILEDSSRWVHQRTPVPATGNQGHIHSQIPTQRSRTKHIDITPAYSAIGGRIDGVALIG